MQDCKILVFLLNGIFLCHLVLSLFNIICKGGGQKQDFKYITLFPRCFEGTLNGLLLGDSGYPLSKHLMTPYLTTQTLAEKSLCRTRVLIEQTKEVSTSSLWN